LTTKSANTNVDWQQRATEFSVGERVMPFGYSDDMAGRVVAVFPAIGMVDVEFPMGNKRLPVEDLQRLDDSGVSIPPHSGDTVPAGAGTVSVPGGPYPKSASGESIGRVARAFVKQSLYWGARDRKYRATKSEIESGHYGCPKCRAQGIESVMQPANYKRREGISEKLMGCGTCLFLIKKLDIENLMVEAV
jgi:hypothetical protein